MTGGNNAPTPVADEEPVADEGNGHDATLLPVAQLASSGEGENYVGSPWMSDHDAPPEPVPNPEDTAAVTVKDYAVLERLTSLWPLALSWTTS